LKKISSNKIKKKGSTEFENQLVKRNYYLLKHQLIFLLDSGLDFLKREYVKQNNDTSFMEFTAQNYYDFILKSYIRKKIKNQINSILNSGLLCINHMIDNVVVDPDYLDNLIEQNYPEYASNDLSLLHSSNNHPGYSELQTISRLTYRIAIIQAAYILSCQDTEVKTYIQLMKKVYPTKKESQDALNSIFAMFNQMVDCFERHLQMITIPFYKPTFNIRDFQFVRVCYEFAIKIVDEQLKELYPEDE
jgi:hypothetical protein